MLDDFSTELKRIGGGASSVLATASIDASAQSAVPEKLRGGLTEVENACFLGQELRINGPQSLAERDCLSLKGAD